ncbi:hypothetical protein J437_LFUL005423 [Ladona fulva]|uniref:DNA repair protein XRCC4 n=1 Tax=Ladona fulva TaxID=123851 RepID=A0A8K0JXY5_LADFU|nr:hypothetical protein J437_LFUL005423 [Ladona fulva]
METQLYLLVKMKESFVCKFPLENIPDETVTVFSHWDDCSFSLKIIHRGKAWEKNVSSDAVKSMSSETPLRPTEFILETKRALTTNEGIEDFTYCLSGDEFTWKKLCEDMKVKYGSVLLEKAPISHVTDAMIEFMMHQKVTLERRTKELEKENSQLTKVNSGLQAEVNKLVSSKNEMEESLYSKFTCLLNAKKEKIEMLEKELGKGKLFGNNKKAQEREADTSGNDKEMESEEEIAEVQEEAGDEFGSETEIDTDEEGMAPSSSKIRRVGSPVKVPQNIDFEDISEDSSSFSDHQRRISEGSKKESKMSIESKSSTQNLQHNPGKYSIKDLLNDM